MGARAAGVETAVAVDIDPILSSSFKINFPESKLHLGDAAKLDRRKLERLLPNGADLVIGGAPCQAFSEMGSNDPNDPRRKLVRQFFRVVAAVDPSAFVFENVRGLAFEKNIEVLNTGLRALPRHWKVLGPVLLDAADFGAATRRKRLFLFGFNTRKAAVPSLRSLIEPLGNATNVRDAISDLSGAVPSNTQRDGQFDQWQYVPDVEPSNYAAQMRTTSGLFTGHAKTRHTETTLARFANLAPGRVDQIGRYPRLTWDGLCPTLRAGTGSEKGSFQAVRPIHPDEDRVITPREAARLQGFPDDFVFHPTIWHSCRMIGNSVSPIIAEALIGRVVSGAGLSTTVSIAAE